MNKVITNFILVFVIFVLHFSIIPSANCAISTITREDDFSVTALPAFWTLDDAPESYSGGGFVIGSGDGIARFNNVGNYAYAHIQTASQLDTTYGIRVDAIMRQDHYPTSTWGMGITIYYDSQNWISIKQGAAGGQNGWMKDIMLNGVRSSQMSGTVVTLRQIFLISGIEITDTQVKFYGSSINPLEDHYLDGPYIDYYVSEITEFTMSRPAEFTGEALIIVGKGYTGSGYPNPDFDNSDSSTNFAFAGIDHVRIQRTIYTPDNCGDAGTVYLPMDFDQNCYVDFKDFASFVSYWLHCNDPMDPYCNQFIN